MISGAAFLDAWQEAGYDFLAGVPCSLLTPLINAALNSTVGTYLAATSEGEALAIAAGAWLAGRQPMAICQNSGLGNMVNPLTSLLQPMRIPVLLLATWRGEPGRSDESQHETMGRITIPLLSLLGVDSEPLPSTLPALRASLRFASDRARAGRPYALLLRDGVIEPESLRPQTPQTRTRGERPSVDHRPGMHRRADMIRAATDVIPPTAALISTTGKCSRELFSIKDTPSNLYVVGSMGCASAIGLGVALNSDRAVVVLDGDGAALMKLGNLATIATANPSNLVHVILDNGVHDSTGGQPTAGAFVDFAAVAWACGYHTTHSLSDVREFQRALEHALSTRGPHLLHVRIAPGSLSPLGRPSLAPDLIARRFREFLQ